MIPSHLQCSSSFMLLVYVPVHRACKCMHDFTHACNSTVVIESLHLMTNSIGFNRI